jgi:hypothetical protein
MQKKERKKVMNTKITKEIVEATKRYDKKFPNLTRHELAKLVGISAASASNIVNGMYDYMVTDTTSEATVTSEIPYEQYKRLVQCELCITELLNSAVASMNDEARLFIDFRSVDGILRKFIPEEYEQKLQKLRGGYDV